MPPIHAELLRRALISGAAWLARHAPHLNAINVFPVPDGDTGTNMTLTMVRALSPLQNRRFRAVGELLTQVARNMLLEAKGNSGVILSQYALGLAEALKRHKVLRPEELAEGMGHAVNWTYRALEQPQEGTILTVMRGAAEAARRAAREGADILELLETAYQGAREALRHTPELLDALKKANVVDAGGEGFLYILEGILKFAREGWSGRLEGIQLREAEEAVFTEEETVGARYCTEAVVEGENLEGHRLRSLLAKLGGSLLIAGAGKLFHIHIHTDWPQKVFEVLKREGRLLSQKVDDMLAQHRRAARKQVVIITDSTADLPAALAQEYGILIVPQQVIIGHRVYKDGIEITREEVLEALLRDEEPMTTSQATPQDFMVAYRLAGEKGRDALFIGVSGGLSGTVRNAEIVATQVSHPKVRVLDSKLVSLGEGLLALRAAEKARQGWPVERIQAYLEGLIPQTLFLFVVDTFKYLARSGRVTRLQGRLGELLRVKPILTLDREGKVAPKGKALGMRRAIRKIRNMIQEELDPTRLYDFAVAHCTFPEVVRIMEPWIRSRFRVRRFLSGELTPVLTLHAGPRAWGVFALPADKEETA